jgi:hypothetical protein
MYTVEKGTAVPFSTVYRTPAQQASMLPWHWPRHIRRGYRIITVVLAKHKNGSLMMVPTWTETCRSDRWNFCFNIPVILWLCASLWNNRSALIMLMHGTNTKTERIWLRAEQTEILRHFDVGYDFHFIRKVFFHTWKLPQFTFSVHRLEH